MREEWEQAFTEAAKELGERAPAARLASIHPDTVRKAERRDPDFARKVRELCPRVRSLRPFGLVLCLALLLPNRAAATITSAPVDLGSAGLTVTVSLRQWTEAAPDSWPTASTAGITVNDLGAGLYTVSGLPAATGSTRYAVTLTAGGISLSTYTYGAQPGTRIVWQEALTLPAAGNIFRAGDTFGSLSVVVRRGLPAAACDGGTLAYFSAANAQTGTALFSNRAAVISDCALDATSGSYGLTLTYDFQSGDLATVARYFGMFKICYSPTSCQSLPSTNTLRWEVVARVGS